MKFSITQVRKSRPWRPPGILRVIFRDPQRHLAKCVSEIRLRRVRVLLALLLLGWNRTDLADHEVENVATQVVQAAA